jgi:Lecithin retinol acyltransferase
MGFEVVESNVLKVCKFSLEELAGFAEHYYLSENANLHNSIGWGPSGVELRGLVRITPQELERVERFMSVVKYNIAVNNCEHFANYVRYGINLSSQENTWWKCLGAEVISLLQPVSGVRDNYNRFISQQIAEVLNDSLRQAKIERANRERIEFWKNRGIDVKE